MAPIDSMDRCTSPVDGLMSVVQFDRVARAVQRRVAEQCGVRLTSVGVYPLGGKSPDEHQARAEIGHIVWMHDNIAELRGSSSMLRQGSRVSMLWRISGARSPKSSAGNSWANASQRSQVGQSKPVSFLTFSQSGRDGRILLVTMLRRYEAGCR